MADIETITSYRVGGYIYKTMHEAQVAAANLQRLGCAEAMLPIVKPLAEAMEWATTNSWARDGHSGGILGLAFPDEAQFARMLAAIAVSRPALIGNVGLEVNARNAECPPMPDPPAPKPAEPPAAQAA